MHHYFKPLNANHGCIHASTTYIDVLDTIRIFEDTHYDIYLNEISCSFSFECRETHWRVNCNAKDKSLTLIQVLFWWKNLIFVILKEFTNNSTSTRNKRNAVLGCNTRNFTPGLCKKMFQTTSYTTLFVELVQQKNQLIRAAKNLINGFLFLL